MTGAPPPANTELPQKEEVDPALLEAAVTLLKRAVRGNGVKPDDVKFSAFSGEVLHFEVFERFAVEPQIAEKVLHGKEGGVATGSLQDARNNAQAAIAAAARSPDVRKNTVDMLKKRPDTGFALEGQFIGLDTLKQTFVTHELCTVCNGSMRHICQSCRGIGKIPCTKCQGTRQILCTNCHGRKTENTPRGVQDCPRCKGRGKMGCDQCKRVGTFPCHACAAAGQVACRNCSGTGWHSHMTYLDMRAGSHFHYEREKLPLELPPLIDTLRAAMVTEKHCAAVINEDKKRVQELDQAAKPDEYFIPYNVRLPWGDISFWVGEKELPAKLFGFQPSLVHMPPFLETTAAPGLRALDAAAAPRAGDVADKIREAVRMRAVAEAVLAAASMPRKRAIEYMHKKYPFGFTAATLKAMVAKADIALKNATRMPRFAGLALGLVAAAGLYLLYYIGPLRAQMAPLFNGPAMQSAADLLLIGLGGLVTTASIQYSARGALHKAIGGLLPPEKRKKFLPKAGKSAILGYAGGVAIYLAAVEMAVRQGSEAPLWYAKLLQLAGF